MSKTVWFTIASYGDESMSYHCRNCISNTLLCVNYLLAAMIKDHKPVNTSRKLYYESTRCSLFSAHFKADG